SARRKAATGSSVPDTTSRSSSSENRSRAQSSAIFVSSSTTLVIAALRCPGPLESSAYYIRTATHVPIAAHARTATRGGEACATHVPNAAYVLGGGACGEGFDHVTASPRDVHRRA